jgi:uncharacterized protein (TIGR04255 family)
MFSKETRCHYRRNQLSEVICQLRFPEILAISEKAPVDFQEAIRADFPQFQRRMDVAAPKISGLPGNMTLQNQPATVNYHFASADGVWRVNLTSRFISLSCSRYSSWEDFAGQLDKPLAAFIQIYKPAYFERVGLRYLNFVSRKQLGLDGVPFSELFTSCYLGPLADEEVSEVASTRCSVDAELGIRGGCRVKLHAGPGMVKRNGQADNEVKFIFDQDLFMPGQVPVNLSAGALQTLHSQAFSIFRGAITQRLHEAMEPNSI